MVEKVFPNPKINVNLQQFGIPSETAIEKIYQIIAHEPLKPFIEAR